MAELAPSGLAVAPGVPPPRASVVRRLEVPDADAVSCHALSKDEQLLALCPNTEDILIFRLQGEEFQRAHVLSKHTQRVTGLAWSCNGRLVSCSEDRQAFVWEPDDTVGWRSVLVELRAPRAALCVSWAPNGLRFAVGLASRDTAVCHYENTVQCWVAWKVGRSKAAVGALAWHPTSQYLATGSTDRRCMVYDVNEAREEPFGQAQVTEDAGAWVNAVAFSPSGRFLAFLGQDSTARVKDLTGGPGAVVTVLRWKRLPFLRGCFLNDKSLVACGFDCVPVLIRQSQGQWEVCGSLDIGPAGSVPASLSAGVDAAGAGGRDAFDNARSRFRGSAAGATASSARKAELPTASSWHSNTITECSSLGGMRFSTSALDGQVLVWLIEM